MDAKSDVRVTVSTSNSEFANGLSIENISNAFNNAVQSEISSNKQKGLPVARYDALKQQAYLEMPDGTREYIDTDILYNNF